MNARPTTATTPLLALLPGSLRLRDLTPGRRIRRREYGPLVPFPNEITIGALVTAADLGFDPLLWSDPIAMDLQNTLVWFEELAKNPSIGSVEWVTNAQSALESAFGQKHAVMKMWATALQAMGQPGSMAWGSRFPGVVGVFKAAHGQLRDGRLGALMDSVRAETVSELLDQAAELNSKPGHEVAAVVLAGGALETHLHALCVGNNLSGWVGEGSISKYDSAIAKERNNGGVEIYSATDSKNVTAWGGLRNDAAHYPTNFKVPAAQVQIMIDGIRLFISKTT